jgi:glycosyltransferase involved in cell wall biosynthesis
MENFTDWNSDHISVCICTYKRQKLLIRLLNKLQSQITDNFFIYSIIIVDNDLDQSAKKSVISFKEKSVIDIHYFNEPEKNIALARNKAVQNAQGNFVAFIDDDEFPDDEWLLALYKSYKKFNADGVFGPVKSHFEIEPPQWIIKGKLHERESFKTGTLLKRFKYTRTGNVLLSMKIFDEKKVNFDPTLGKTGGEDTAFFKRMIESGCVFVWCNEACVYETVPSERFTRAYFLKRALLRGVVSSRYVSFISFSMLKSLIAFILYTSALPFLFLIGDHIFMIYLIKDCDHIGKILALCGLKVIKERASQEWYC